MTKVETELLEKYASYFAGRLMRQGYDFPKEEVAGELAAVYASVIERYDYFRDVQFNTYLIAAFKNRISTLVKKLKEDQAFKEIEFNEAVHSHAHHTTEDQVVVDSLKAAIYRRLHGRELIVFHEMISPTAKLCEAIHGIVEMQKGIPQVKRITNGNGAFALAIKLVYGYSDKNVRRMITSVRRKSKKILDF